MLEFEEGLLVTLPRDRADAYLRHVSSEPELASVRRALRWHESPDQNINRFPSPSVSST